jgi:predicted amidophosphoribosyltransferase
VNFCPNCGADQARPRCPSCQANVDTGWQYCIDCGAPLSRS